MNRDIGVGTSSYVIERFFHFQQGKKWFDKVIYDEKEHIIFALNDLNVTIFDCTNQKAFATIENAHDAAITKVCWHPHHKVYITGSGYVVAQFDSFL
jgi:WD40 repeat protein